MNWTSHLFIGIGVIVFMSCVSIMLLRCRIVREFIEVVKDISTYVLMIVVLIKIVNIVVHILESL